MNASNLSWPSVVEIAENLDGLEQDNPSVHFFGQGDLILEDRTVKVRTLETNPETFSLFGHQLEEGRFFTAESNQQGAAPVALLSHEYWTRAFRSDPGVLGRVFELDGVGVEIIGILAPDERFVREPVEMILPLLATNSAAPFRGVNFLRVYWKLEPGKSLEAFQTQLREQGKLQAELFPDFSSRLSYELTPIKSTMVAGVEKNLWILFGSVLCLLLISGMNFTNMLLARSVSREGELAVRQALGARPRQLFLLFFNESLIIAAFGTVVGLLIAWWFVDLVSIFYPGSLPRWNEVSLNWAVALFACLTSTVLAAAASLFPLARLVRSRKSGQLQQKSNTRSTGNRANRNLLQALVIGQVTLALVLLSTSGLLIFSLYKLNHADLGFATENRFTIQVTLPEARYNPYESGVEVHRQFRTAVKAALADEPSIRDFAFISEIPVAGGRTTHRILFEAFPLENSGDAPTMTSRSVDWNFFNLMEIPVIKGRNLSPDDHAEALPVAIVNQALVKKYFPDRDPMGERFKWQMGEGAKWITIVGVVPDIRHFGLRTDESPVVYTPFSQNPFAWKNWMPLVIHHEGDLTQAIAAGQQAIASADPLLHLETVRTFDGHLADRLAQDRFNSLFLSIFATSALLLAGLGIYSLLFFITRSRRQELAIRSALGADAEILARGVILGAVKLGIIGALIGLPVAIALRGGLQSLLYRPGLEDFLIFPTAAILLLGLTAVASLLPAQQTAAINPVEVLRDE